MKTLLRFELKKISLFCVLGLLIFFGWQFLRKPVAATVGETDIYVSDAQARDRIVRLYYPQETRAMGLFQLIKSAFNLEVLKNHGVELSEEQILQEEKRILQSSQNPDLLKAIREVFGEDHEAFLRVFVLPTLVDRFIYFDFFLNNPSVHAESLAQAQNFLKSLQTAEKKNFKEAALQVGLQPMRLTLNQEGAFLQAEGSKEKIPYGSAEEIKQWREKVLSLLSSGEVFPEPVSLNDSWGVIHLAQKTQNNEFQIELVQFRKLDFHSWLQQEKKKINFEIEEPSLLPNIPL